MAFEIEKEKSLQAQQLLEELGIDCWLTFVRETGIRPDPGIELVLGTGLTWVSALLFFRGERPVAIVGSMDASAVRQAGDWGEVLGYDQDIRSHFARVITERNPKQIAVNYSLHDVTADGLTVGMLQLLNDLLADTPCAGKLISAGPLLSRLRSRKSAAEIGRIRAAIKTTEDVIQEIDGWIRPGISELELASAIHAAFRARSVEAAWGWDGCPIVNAGPGSELGHSKPQPHLRVAPGEFVHIDLGVRQGGFCSDMQRMWFVLPQGQTAPPAEAQRAFDTIIRSIDAAVEQMRPGARGHEIDAAARGVVTSAGYPEYQHGTGHGLGRAVHDGGTMLGPKWPKYGTTPDGILEPGNVFTVEPSIKTPWGVVGIEEDVLVTANGCEFLSSYQTKLRLIRTE